MFSKVFLYYLLYTCISPLDHEFTLWYLFPFCFSLVIPYFMMISGYVYAVSFERRGIKSIEQAYNKTFVAEKFIRYTVPYTIAFIAEWIVFRVFGTYLVGIRTYGIFAFVMDYLSGGKGLGNYYYPIMIQLIFLFPIIYFVIKKYNLKGLWYCFLVNAGYEVLKVAYGMNEYEYRLLLFRYLFVIAAGCYVAVGDIRRNKKLMALSSLCIVARAGFAYLFSYTDYAPKIITYWSTTSFAVCLLIYHNFADRMYALIPNRGLQLTFNFINCVGVGLLFYYIEQPITRYLIKKIKKCLRHSQLP